MTEHALAEMIERRSETYDIAERAWRGDPTNDEIWESMNLAKSRLADAVQGNLPAILTALRRPEPAAGDVEAVNAATDAWWQRYREHGQMDWRERYDANVLREDVQRACAAHLAALPRPEAIPLHTLPDDELDAMWATIGETAPTAELRALVANYRAAGKLSKAALDGETVPLPRPEADEGAVPSPSEYRSLLDACWAINDKLRITPGMEAIFTGSTNDIDAFRDLLHELEPAYRSAAAQERQS